MTQPQIDDTDADEPIDGADLPDDTRDGDAADEPVDEDKPEEGEEDQA